MTYLPDTNACIALLRQRDANSMITVHGGALKFATSSNAAAK